MQGSVSYFVMCPSQLEKGSQIDGKGSPSAPLAAVLLRVADQASIVGVYQPSF